ARMANVIVRLLVIKKNVFSAATQRISFELANSNSRGNQMRYAVYPQNIPPKNRTSVTRNIHIPSRSAECCCSRLLKWCLSTGEWVLADNVGLLLHGPGRPGHAGPGGRALAPARGLGQPAAELVHPDRVLVRAAHHHRDRVEVVDRRRAGRLPLQPGR